MEGIKNTINEIQNKHTAFVQSKEALEKYQRDGKEENMTYQRDASKSLDDEIKRAENVFDWVLKEQEHITQSTNRKEELLRQVEEYKTNIERMGNEMKKEEGENEKKRYEVGNELCKMYKEKHDIKTKENVKQNVEAIIA